MYQTTVKEFLKDEAGNLTGAIISCLKPERDPETGRTSMVPTGKEFTYDCQLAFIAAGFTGCETYTADAFGVELTARGNVADHRFRPTWIRFLSAAICAAARALWCGVCVRAAIAPPRWIAA